MRVGHLDLQTPSEPRPTGSLAGARAKLRRAVSHRDALDDALQEFVDDYLGSATVSVEPDGTSIRVAGQSPPSDAVEDWALEIGECFQQARAALDYLAFELTGLPAVTTKTHHGTGANRYFPLAKNNAAWKSMLGRGYLDGVNTEHTEMIEAFQPYAPTQLGPSATALVLNEVRERSNPEKHNLLIPAQPMVTYSMYIVPEVGLGGDVTFTLDVFAVPGGAVLPAPDVSTIAAKVGSHFDPTQFLRSRTDFHVQFAEYLKYRHPNPKAGAPVVPQGTINEILWASCSAVQHILDAFEPEFARPTP